MSERSKKYRVNEKIDVDKIRLIGEDGAQLGVVTVQEGIKTALASSLDLVEISPQSDPPVCRLMDYNKFLFEQRKSRANSKRNQRQKRLRVQIKEIKLRVGTEEGDYLVKLRNALRFLSQGYKVKFSLRFRGREVVHPELGVEMMQRIVGDIEKEGCTESAPKLEGRQMVMVIAPLKRSSGKQ